LFRWLIQRRRRCSWIFVFLLSFPPTTVLRPQS
jgi:hypothetical protein